MAVISRTAAELSVMLGAWHDDSGPLSAALADGIAELIDANMIPAGTALPAQRELARQLGIARGTVTSAYGLLEQRGRLLTRTGSGSRVRAELSAPGANLTGRLPDDRLVSIGSLSKLFWGAIRVGWIRTSRSRVRTLLEARKTVDLSTSVTDQLIAVRLLEHADEARTERAAMLRAARSVAEELLHEHLPRWSWSPVGGGAALWIDTGEDAAALAERAKQAGLLVSAGPNFSAHGSHRNHLRLPVARDRATLDRALATMAGLTADRRR